MKKGSFDLLAYDQGFFQIIRHSHSLAFLSPSSPEGRRAQKREFASAQARDTRYGFFLLVEILIAFLHQLPTFSHCLSRIFSIRIQRQENSSVSPLFPFVFPFRFDFPYLLVFFVDKRTTHSYARRSSNLLLCLDR